MITLAVLIWLHMLGDYPLQGDFLANMKGRNYYLLFVHCVLWTGAICFGLFVFGLLAWWKVAMLLVGHFIIDRWKARKVDKAYSLTRDLWIDQVLHLFQLLLCLI